MCIDLVHVDCDEPFLISGPKLEDRYLVQIPFSGTCTVEHAGHSFTADEGSVFVINPFAPSQKRWEGGCQQLMLWIDRSAIERVLADELGRGPSRPLEFFCTNGPGKSGNAALARRLVDLAAHAAGLGGAETHWRDVRQLERSLLVSLLTSLPHTYRRELDRAEADTAPYSVRRVESFFRERFGAPVLMREVLEVAGTSARSLFYAFRAYRNTTPMRYLKQLRLREARRRLQRAAETGSRVTDIALECGYSHLGMFARDYKSRYGESPSETRKGGVV